eukprot:Phypoly_transcript_06822.p1 GENE.Phypoly_transcript_06822~~Phypoly_transcript_06822.p1  ORF type:complete len:550 (+),score=104.27 Phypoly_transcript_06822:70-1719(+)
MMFRVFVLVLCLSCICFCAEIKLNGPKECPTHHVTVYPDRAEVSRHVKINPTEKGDLSVKIEGLSTSIDKNSVSVAFGLGDATLLEVGCHESHSMPINDGGKAKLQGELEEITDSIFVVKAKKDRIAKELDYLEVWARKQANKEADGDLDNFFEIYDKKSKELEGENYNTNKRMELLKKKKEELEHKIFEFTVPQDAKVTVEILLRVNNPGEINLVLSYVVSDTAWTPKYDIRVSSETSSATITYYGTIINLSNENWTDVSLALSTASTTSKNPPTLQTLHIGEVPYSARHLHAAYERPIPSYNVMDDSDGQERGQFSMKMSASAIPKMETMTANIVTGMSASHFNIPRKTDILSDGISRKVTIAILDLPCNLLYEVMPKVSAHAYLKANVTNNSDYPLLPGPANVFLDNNFVSETKLKYIPGNEKLEVFLGIDNAIVVERKADKVYSEKTGFLVQSTVQTYHHESTIKNTKKIKVPITIYEQVPLSTNDQIKVHLKKPILEGEKKEQRVEMDKNNILVWNTVLPPGETQTFVAKYQVESPVGTKLQLY